MRVAYGLILAVALILRLWGISFGLPELYHPDEPAYVLQALAVARGLPDGLTFANPPLFKYVLLGEYAVVYGAQRAAGATHSPQEFIDQFRADPSLLYLLARVSSASFGALTAIAAGVLGAAVGGQRAGILAAALTAVTFLLVRDSHFGVNDALVTLLVTVGLVFSVRIATHGSRRDYVLAGALAGLAFSAKYHGIALLVPVVVAHVARWPQSRRFSYLAISGLACVVAALVTFPSMVTEPSRVVNDVYVHLVAEAIAGYDGLDPAGGYVFYARTLVVGLGWPLLIASLSGVVLATLRRDRRSLIVAALPLVLLLTLGASRLYFARFALPALPALVVEASLALDALFVRQALLGILAALLVAAPTLVDASRFDWLMSQTDTRALAGQWMSANLVASSVVALDAPPLGPTPPSTLQTDVANGWSLFDLTPEDYRGRGIDYVVVSSFTAEARAVDPQREARRQAFNAALPAEGTLVAQFLPYAGEREPSFVYDQIYGPITDLNLYTRPGPTITIYRLNAI